MKLRQLNTEEYSQATSKSQAELKVVKNQTGSVKEKSSMSSNKKEDLYIERVNEQKLLYFLFNLLETNKDVNFVLQTTADKLSSVSQLHKGRSARVIFDSVEYVSSDFKESQNTMVSFFETSSGKTGKIELHFKSNFKFKPIGLIFKEAQMLIEGISQILCSWLNRRDTEKALEKMFVHLEMKIEKGTEQLKKANKKLLDINKDINDSINYANRIQRAILPTNQMLNNSFNDAFVLYKPKDIVSGDFYWLHKTEDKIFYACADCTGHSVPGALMSMVGHQLLDHIITDRNITDPELILEEMDNSIIRLFKKSQIADHLRDGMAMSLCVIDLKHKNIMFSGALNNAYMFVNNEMVTLIADRLSIGGSEVKGGKKFTKTVKEYSDGDLLYMFTDGLPDQFGGPNGKKLMRKNLLELIEKNKSENMDLQGEIFESFFENWKGNDFQVDDVTLLGVKL